MKKITVSVDTSGSLTKEEIWNLLEMVKDCRRRNRWYYKLFKFILNDKRKRW
jgi:predicted metal-dependent peptidase